MKMKILFQCPILQQKSSPNKIVFFFLDKTLKTEVEGLGQKLIPI